MKILNTDVEVACGNFEWGCGCESLDARFLEWVFTDRFVELAITRVGSVNWRKWD
jgi:hypothetical protein